MFTIAGILADEEPKTAISPNGLYNSSNLSSSDLDYDLDSDPLAGLSEFTFMLWAYISPPSSTYSFIPYVGTGGSGLSRPIILTQASFTASIKNSNGGTTTVLNLQTNTENAWVHYCVTGSVSNGRIRIYQNGVLLNSATMTYANASTTDARFDNIDDIDISQCNIYNRELSESEVAEHYVNQNGQVGVLSYDAMTTGQRSGLIYCASLTNDISFDGNEFKDRSTSNISLSPQPSLTGQQIYVYTALSQVYTVNSIVLNGTNQYVVSTNSSNYNFGTDTVFVSGWVKSGENHKLYFKGNETGTSSQDLFINAEVLSSREVVFDLSVNVSNRRQWVTTATPIPNDGNWHHVAIYHARTDDTTQPVLWVDGVSQGAIPQSYTIGSGWASANFTQTQPMKLGITAIPAFYGDGTGVFVNTIKGYSPTQADIDELYNSGTPRCYTDVDPTLKARFMSFIDCGTYNGRTEAQALTEHVESELFTNVNSAPFTGTGLSVECST